MNPKPHLFPNPQQRNNSLDLPETVPAVVIASVNWGCWEQYVNAGWFFVIDIGFLRTTTAVLIIEVKGLSFYKKI
jgi:hypothetical protein